MVPNLTITSLAINALPGFKHETARQTLLPGPGTLTPLSLAPSTRWWGSLTLSLSSSKHNTHMLHSQASLQARLIPQPHPKRETAEVRNTPTFGNTHSLAPCSIHEMARVLGAQNLGVASSILDSQTLALASNVRQHSRLQEQVCIYRLPSPLYSDTIVS
jgi:hypothetical protein